MVLYSVNTYTHNLLLVFAVRTDLSPFEGGFFSLDCSVFWCFFCYIYLVCRATVSDLD